MTHMPTHTHTEYTKLDVDKRLVYGWAYIAKDAQSQPIVDNQGDTILSEDELTTAVASFIEDSRQAADMHITPNVGHLVESMVITHEKLKALGIADPQQQNLPALAWWVGYKITDDATWTKIKDGARPMFSIGGFSKQRKVRI